MATFGLWSAWCMVALAAAAMITRALVPWTRARAIVDHPTDRGCHASSTPRGGGLAIVAVVAAVGATLLLLRLDDPRLAGAILPALAVAAVSWRDDVRSLRNSVRFAVHLAAAVAAAAVLGPVTRVDLGGFGVVRLGAAAWPLTILWVVGLTNAFNFMDGIDGIAGITAAAAGAGIAAAAAACAAGPVAVLAAAFAGAALGFLTCNWQPARIFMGDVGSTFCGCLLAVLPLAVPADCVPEVLPVAVLALWPFIFDSGFTLLRRLTGGENIFRPHRSHLYQRLVLSGWSHRTVAGIYGGLSACLAAVAVTPLIDPTLRSAASGVATALVVAVPVMLVGLVAVVAHGAEPAP
jgi:UDP-N-acetylmuramyl pentapeptide phosphotransferase/UDP-N-acetylglucosamine-1-phosphate transferase